MIQTTLHALTFAILLAFLAAAYVMLGALVGGALTFLLKGLGASHPAAPNLQDSRLFLVTWPLGLVVFATLLLALGFVVAVAGVAGWARGLADHLVELEDRDVRHQSPTT